ncbi:MAG: extracellular solute-binding protein [Pseudomonadota bacterium]
MKRTKVNLILVILAAIFSFAFVSSAYAAESINAYMSITPEQNKKIANFIQQKTGIVIRQTFQSAEEVHTRVAAETPNYNADICVGNPPLAFLAKEKGWSVRYDSPGWKGVGPAYADPEGYWFNIGNITLVLVGSKDRLAKAGYTLPTSWKELLDTKWKGEIIVPSPLSSGTAVMMQYTLLGLYGEEEGWKYFEALDKNINHYTRSGSTPCNLVARGEFMLGLTGDENIKSLLDQGYPLVWDFPQEGTGYQGQVAFILKGTKKLETCKKVIDIMGSQEFSDMMAKTGYSTPRPAATNPLWGKRVPKYVDLDIGEAAKNKLRWVKIWKEKFRGFK